MNLLERIACSHGSPDRAKVALNLICTQRLQLYGRMTEQAKTHHNFVCPNRPTGVTDNRAAESEDNV